MSNEFFVEATRLAAEVADADVPLWGEHGLALDPVCEGREQDMADLILERLAIRLPQMKFKFEPYKVGHLSLCIERVS